MGTVFGRHCVAVAMAVADGSGGVYCNVLHGVTVCCSADDSGGWKRCSVLLCVAQRCGILQRVAACFAGLIAVIDASMIAVIDASAAVCESLLHCVMCCSVLQWQQQWLMQVLQSVASRCIALPCVTFLFSMLQCRWHCFSSALNTRVLQGVAQS